MKKILKITGITLVSILAILYLAFLFIVPRVVKIDTHVEQIKTIVKEQSKLDLILGNARVVTFPNLSAGVELRDVKVNLPDNSTILSSDNIKLGLSIPALLKLDAKLTKAQIDNLNINAEIKDGKQYKILLVIQDLINEKKKTTSKKIDEPGIWEKNSTKIRLV
jgi:uncharacterized protein involved in outer membrane biogenesis